MPADSNVPNPLDEIQAVLDSYCHIPDLNLADAPGLDCDNPSTDSGRLDFSLFSPKHKPAPPRCAVQPTNKNKHSIIQPGTSRLATSSRLTRRRRPPHRNNTLAAVPPRKTLTKPTKRTIKTRKARENLADNSNPPVSPLTHPPLLDTRNIDDNAMTKKKDARTTASNDDEESNEFIEQMRQLTAKKLEVEKQKREAARKKTIQRIDELTAEGENEMRRVAGITSKNISKAVSSLKRLLPKNSAETMANAQKVLDGQEASNPSFFDEMQKFDNLMRTAESKIKSQQMQNLRMSRTKEERLQDAAETVSSKRKRFSKVLSTVEKVLKNTEMPR